METTINPFLYCSLINVCFKRIQGECNFEALFLSDKEVVVLEDKVIVGVLSFDNNVNDWHYNCIDAGTEKILKMWLTKHLKDTDLSVDYLRHLKAEIAEIKPEVKKVSYFKGFEIVRVWNVERAA